MHTAFFKLISKDHKKIMGIFEKLEESPESTSKKLEELFDKLRKKLTSHLKAEGSAFYKPLIAANKKKAHEKALEGMEQHQTIENVLKELEKMPKNEDRWGAKMHVFKELVEHHFQDEESKIFKSAKKALSDDEFANIITQFEREKQKIKKPTKQPARKRGEVKV